MNAVHRAWETAKAHVALVFPDTYEVGQSGLGLKILYGLLAADPEVLVERVFSPWVDCEEKLRASGTPLFSLESSRPLGEFDLLGFTLPYEMTYTNVLNVLEMAQIPVFSEDRDDRHPLIAGGGSCAFNAEPLAPFFDFFVLGEGEEVLPEILELIKVWKRESRRKHELLRELQKIKGVYVPCFYEPRYNAQGILERVVPLHEGMPSFIEKRVIADLDSAYFPVNPVVPYVETIHDRVMLELYRGCTHGCRFCQAGMIYRPVRERSLPGLLSIAEKSLKNTGYEEISLMSLSCSDYSRIRDLASSIMERYRERYIEVSLPSLRIDSFSLDLATLVQRFRRTTLTFAPEVGTQRMRDLVNKGGSEEDVLNTLSLAKKMGWQAVKLYFMVGLPGEREEDILGISSLVWKILQQTGLKMNVSVSSFVPKPWTTFQWDAFDTLEKIQEKTAVIKRVLRHGKISLSFHHRELSFLEAVFSRGDRHLSRVLVEARKRGCRFDGWSDHFRSHLWFEAFERTGIDPLVYTGRRSMEGALAWDHLGSDRLRAFLLADRARADEGITLSDCRKGECHGCGVCRPPELSTVYQQGQSGENRTGEMALSDFQQKPVQRIRVKLTKDDAVRLISHLDWIRTIQRLLLRAEIPVAYTEGFHPHMRLAFGPALSVGFSSEAEWIDVDLSEHMKPALIAERLSGVSPEGIRILSAREIPRSSRSLCEILHLSCYRVVLAPPAGSTREALQDITASIMGETSIEVKRKEKLFDLRPLISRLEILSFDESEAVMEFSLRLSNDGSARPAEIVELIRGRGFHCTVKCIGRTGLFTKQGSQWVEP